MIELKPYLLKVNEYKNAVELIKALKHIYVKNQDYETAANLRDQEKKTEIDLNNAEEQVTRIRNRIEITKFGEFVQKTFNLTNGAFYLANDSASPAYNVDDVYMFYIEELNKGATDRSTKRKVEINQLVEELKNKFTNLNDKLEDATKQFPEKSLWRMTGKCEHENCGETSGFDYRRKPSGSSLDTEPIFLCDKHNKGFEIFTV